MKRIICILLAVFLLVLGCAGCQPTGGNDPTPEPTPTPTPIPDDPKPGDEPTVQSPEQLLAAMTLEEKIGQLFIIRPESLDLHTDSGAGTQHPGLRRAGPDRGDGGPAV